MHLCGGLLNLCVLCGNSGWFLLLPNLYHTVQFRNIQKIHTCIHIPQEVKKAKEKAREELGVSGEIQTEEEDKEKKGGERRTSAVGKRNIRTGRGNHGIVMLEEILERIGSNIDNAMLR